MRFVDCQNLAGSFSLGAVRAGFEMAHRVALPGGFGNAIVEHNRALLPGDWVTQTGGYEEWTPQDDVALLTGTPPCSGFSVLNTNKEGVNTRGADSHINDCMKALVEYAARCRGTDGRRGPEVVTFESVQGAGKDGPRGGRSLMNYLRGLLVARTREDYQLTHVFMSGAAVGAAQLRHRYFVVFHRVPFGVDAPEPPFPRARTYRDAMEDLVGLENRWDEQYLDRVATTENQRRYWNNVTPLATVDGHVWPTDGSITRRTNTMLELGWAAGETDEKVAQRLTERPANWTDRTWERARDNTLIKRVRRVAWEQPGYILTGDAGLLFVHPDEDRHLSARECYRLMGFPDAWSLTCARNVHEAYRWAGKQMPVESSTWIASWIRSALEGDPGAVGERIGEEEFKVDVTRCYVK